MPRLALLLPILLLPACATVIKGTGQDVAVSSEPDGASCVFLKKTAQHAAIQTTPATVHIDRSSDDLVVTCEKAGYQKTAQTLHPSFNGVTFGNLLIGGPIGFIVDAATGANLTYPDKAHVVLPAASPAPPPSQAPAGPYVPGQAIVLQPQQPGV